MNMSSGMPTMKIFMLAAAMLVSQLAFVLLIQKSIEWQRNNQRINQRVEMDNQIFRCLADKRASEESARPNECWRVGLRAAQ